MNETTGPVPERADSNAGGEKLVEEEAVGVRIRTSPFPRASGILLHPTSLPGGQGVGDLGGEAYRFVDFLNQTGQLHWQVLPLNPPGLGDSPYAACSAFAGNPLLISCEKLVEEGLLQATELEAVPRLPEGRVDYPKAHAAKNRLLELAFGRFRSGRATGLRAELEAFSVQHASWLEDYALFMALKSAFGQAAWTGWDADLTARQPAALARWREKLAEEIAFQRFLQLVFFQQWTALRRYARTRQVQLVGDLPIFVAHDSADVWANSELFQLDSSGQPTSVAGVPPDYFSPTGQRWGNPLYRWDAMAGQGYRWWLARFRTVLAMVDAARIDHFRGFQAYWEVPATHPTAEHGRWVEGPGAALFEALEMALGPLPIIVEDLGLITPDVVALRERLGYPGMKVLQFAFGSDAGNPYLPHNYERNCVVYTATHDNDTTPGWFAGLSDDEQAHVKRYVGTASDHIAWSLIRLALASVANTAIVPLQDVLELGSEGRMNSPGKAEGNWTWRYRSDQLTAQHAEKLGELTATYRRVCSAGT